MQFVAFEHYKQLAEQLKHVLMVELRKVETGHLSQFCSVVFQNVVVSVHFVTQSLVALRLNPSGQEEQLFELRQLEHYLEQFKQALALVLKYYEDVQVLTHA